MDAIELTQVFRIVVAKGSFSAAARELQTIRRPCNLDRKSRSGQFRGAEP